MPLLIVLLLLLCPNPAGGETLHFDVWAAPETARMLTGIPELQAGIHRLFAAEYGALVSLSSDSEPAPASSSGSSPAASPLAASVRLSPGPSGNGVTVSTDFTREQATRSLVSTVPSGSPSSLLATITGDLAFLYVSSRGFATLPLAAPPPLVASLSTDTLGVLTGWNLDELEPVGLASSGDEITICFPHRYLTLGPLFRISASTIRDINAQGAAREPMQLSGLVRGEGGRIVLLSQREGRLALVDPRLGTRTLIDAPGLSGLPARAVGPTTIAALPGTTGEPGVRLYSAAGGLPRVLRVSASYVPAFDIDSERNVWAWDAGERRLRILTLQGQEVFSVRPMLSAATMPLPQQLAVFDDGSFLLAGSGEVWKFVRSGMPEWRLTRVPGRPGESLPSSFNLVINRGDGSLTILDPQSRRLLSFSASAGSDESRLGALLGRLDSRKPADIRELAAFARTGGLGLMAMQFGEMAARSGGLEAERTTAREALLREKASGYVQLADALTRDLLYERADGAWLRASESLRQLAAERPDDEAAAGTLQTALARRREIRAALSGPAEIQEVSARLLAGRQSGCQAAMTLEVTLRNPGSQPARDMRMHASLPTVTPSPFLAEIGELPPLKERSVRIPLGAAAVSSSEASFPVFALFTYERGQEGRTLAMSFPAKAVQDASPVSLAETLACAAAPQDELAAHLAETLLNGSRSIPPRPLAELAGILDSLGAARVSAAGYAGTTQPGTAPAPAVPAPPAPPGSASPGPWMRNFLRALSPEESEWTIVTASIASSLGIPAAIVTVAERPFAVVDTGTPFGDAFAAVPGLQRYQQTLAALSHGGTVWLPLSGRVPPGGSDPSAWAAADALAALAAAGTTSLSRAGIDASSAQPSRPVPFPLVLPVIRMRRSITELQDALDSALSGSRPQ